MRVCAGERSLPCVCSAPLAPGPAGIANTQAPVGCASRCAVHARPECEPYTGSPRSRPEDSPRALRDDPQSVADCSKFLAEPDGMVIGSILAPLPREQNSRATQNMLLHAFAWIGKQPVNELVDYKLP